MSAPDSPHPFSGWTWDRVVVAGPDAVSFVQGQVSQDVTGLAIGASAWSFILEPTGKVCALFLVTRSATDALTCDIDPGFADALVARINRFKIRIKADVSIETIGQKWSSEAEADRIARGWPAMGVELNGTVIPGETGLIDTTVSFTKGCYTGQELVARVDSRGGNVPRHLRWLRVSEPSSEFVVGAQLLHDGKVVGAISSVVGSSGLAYVHRTVEAPGEVDCGSLTVRVEAIQR